MNISLWKSQKLSLMLVLLATLSGCGGNGKCCKKRSCDADMPAAQDSMEMAQANVRSFFDQDIEEFVAFDDTDMALAESDFEQYMIEEPVEVALRNTVVAHNTDDFKTVYFDFDKYALRDDQEDTLSFDVAQAEQVLAEAQARNIIPTIVIEGHACHSAGSSIYNLALSEKRAKAVSDWFEAQGIPHSHIKVVGRGQEVPAMVDGKPVSGDRLAQWPNRRVEVKVLMS